MSSRSYVALLADAIGSRTLPPPRRARLQADLRRALPELNRAWRRVLAAPFGVVLGDELQCLLPDARAVWAIAHALRARFADVDWVVACGHGPLTTPIARGVSAPELDGPCFHAARAALEAAKNARLVFTFGGFDDPVLDGLAGYYSALYWSWTRRQRRAANEFRANSNPPSALRPRSASRGAPSALSHLRRRMAWPLVQVGDKIFRDFLNRA